MVCTITISCIADILKLILKTRIIAFVIIKKCAHLMRVPLSTPDLLLTNILSLTTSLQFEIDKNSLTLFYILLHLNSVLNWERIFLNIDKFLNGVYTCRWLQQSCRIRVSPKADIAFFVKISLKKNYIKCYLNDKRRINLWNWSPAIRLCSE